MARANVDGNRCTANVRRNPHEAWFRFQVTQSLWFRYFFSLANVDKEVSMRRGFSALFLVSTLLGLTSTAFGQYPYPNPYGPAPGYGPMPMQYPPQYGNPAPMPYPAPTPSAFRTVLD